MFLRENNYFDSVSKQKYFINSNIPINRNYSYLIKGENGVGKTRFIEGVVLKELKQRNYKILYFGQDIENQILTFNLISLVKEFVDALKSQKSFFKTIFLNDESHESIKLDFSQKDTLEPDNRSKYTFITHECSKYSDLDFIIFDEVDKYFKDSNEFNSFLLQINCPNKIIISHILEGDFKTIYLNKNSEGVNVEFIDN